MRVEYHSDFTDVELKDGEPYYALPSSSYIKIIPDNNGQSIEVVINGQYIDSDDYAYIPINETAEIVVHSIGKPKKYEVKPVAKLLAPKFSAAYGDFDFQFLKVKNNPLEAILLGELKMYAVEQSAEVEDITKILEKLEVAYLAFKRICDKPKSHLKAVNEVRPIETVKRVGYESIPYLASHSEDWLAKTASGLKPARLFSRVEDDEFQIYENRVVKTAIDLIYSFLQRSRVDLEYKAKQLWAIISSSVQTNSFGFDAGFQRAVSELIPQDYSGDEHRSKQLELAERLLEKTTMLWKKYRVFHHSKLYRYLRRTKNVSNPLNETNILLIDKDYSVIFKLWKDIYKVIALKESDKVNPDEGMEQHNSYKLFCKALCEYTAHTMNFEQTGEDVFLRESDNLQIAVKEEHGQIVIKIMDAKKRALRIDKPLVCPINQGEFLGKFEYRNQTLYWSNDTTTDEIEELCALLKTRESRGKVQAEEKARYATLKSELDRKQREYGVPKSHKIVILTTFCDVEDETRNRFSEYMKNIANEVSLKSTEADYIVIALPRCESNEQKLTSYAKQSGEKVAFLPLTMFDINSYRRLQGLFLRLILKIRNGKCPYCGSDMRGSGSRYECTACRLIITETICDDPSCRHKYTYLSYDVKPEVVENMRLVESDKFFERDSIFQYKDIVSLSVGEKIIPICPRCGN